MNTYAAGIDIILVKLSVAGGLTMNSIGCFKSYDIEISKVTLVSQVVEMTGFSNVYHFSLFLHQ